MHDVVLKGGRVVDPASGTDAVLDLGIRRGVVAETGHDLQGHEVLDCTGCVVAPGFVDLHSHAQSLEGHRLQALDGVTTSLDLEAGVARVDLAYARAEREGMPLHHGWSASWAAARMSVLADVPPDGELTTVLHHLGDEAWQRPATREERHRIVGQLERDLAAGGLGIGVLVGYAPGTGPDEYLQVAALAASLSRPVYTHARDLVELLPSTVVDGAEELVRAAAETGAHMHYCHVNSTSLRHVDRVLDLVARAQAEGSHISTEAYPYGAGATALGAAFLTPERLPERGLVPSDLVYTPTGERIADAERLLELRAADPGAVTVVHFLDESRREDQELLLRSLRFPDACIASDAMPVTWRGSDAADVWPLPPEAYSHPRTAGTFARSFRRLVVEEGLMDVVEFVRRASTLPGQVLGAATGGAVGKGRLTPGAMADVVVLDLDAFRDRATYEQLQPSDGVRHLLVNGSSVVRHGALVLDARPGLPVRG